MVCDSMLVGVSVWLRINSEQKSGSCDPQARCITNVCLVE
jgi:hypothetical protein